MKTASPIVIEKNVNAHVSRVWRALTDLAEMRQWYFPIDAFEPKPGWDFNFYAGPPHRRYHHCCTIIDAVPNARLSYTWRYPELCPGCNTLVTWELRAGGDNNTRVRLTHTGVDAFPKSDPNFARASFVAGWTHILGKSLKPHVEK